MFRVSTPPHQPINCAVTTSGERAYIPVNRAYTLLSLFEPHTPDGTKIASGSRDNTVKLWNTNTDKSESERLRRLRRCVGRRAPLSSGGCSLNLANQLNLHLMLISRLFQDSSCCMVQFIAVTAPYLETRPGTVCQGAFTRLASPLQ